MIQGCNSLITNDKTPGQMLKIEFKDNLGKLVSDCLESGFEGFGAVYQK